MKKIIAILNVMAIILSLFVVAPVQASTPLIGTPDRAQYLNAGPNTVVTVNFNKELKVLPTVRFKQGDSQSSVNVYSAFSILSADKKTVTVDFAQCANDENFARNREHTIILEGCTATDGTRTTVTIPVTTRNFEYNYINEDMERLTQDVDWIENGTSIPDAAKLSVSPQYASNGSSQGLKNKAGTAYNLAQLLQPGEKLEINNGKFVTGLFDNYQMKVVADPKGANNKVLMLDAGWAAENAYDGANHQAAYLRVGKSRVKASEIDGNRSKIVADKSLVHRFKVYVPKKAIYGYAKAGNVQPSLYAGNIGGDSHKDTSMQASFRPDAANKRMLMTIIDGNSKWLQLPMYGDQWYEVEYVVKPNNGVFNTTTVKVNDTYYSLDAEGKRQTVKGDVTLKAPLDSSKYSGFGFSVIPMTQAEAKGNGTNLTDDDIETPKMYIDDLRSFSLEDLTAMSGDTWAEGDFQPAMDKVIINFTNEVSLEDVKNALIVTNKADSSAVSADKIGVAMTDNNTTAVIDLSGAGMTSGAAYVVNVANTLTDRYGQALVSEYVKEVKAGTIKEYKLNAPASVNNFRQGVDRVVTVSADEEVDASAAQVTVKDNTGAVVGTVVPSVSADSKTISMQLSGVTLSGNAPYTLNVAGVKDLATGAVYNPAVIPIAMAAAQAYLINDDFESQNDANWIEDISGYTGNKKWLIQAKNGASGNLHNNGTLKYNTTPAVLTDAYVGIATIPDKTGNESNKVFKFSPGSVNANGSYGYRAVRSIDGKVDHYVDNTSGYKSGALKGDIIDLEKNIVAKYDLYLNKDIANLLINDSLLNDIPGVTTRNNGEDNATNGQIKMEDGKLVLYNRYKKVQELAMGEWIEIAYVITPDAINPENTVKTDAPVWKYQLYINGVPTMIGGYTTDAGQYGSCFPGGFATTDNPGNKHYGFNMGLMPNEGSSATAAMYVDNMQYLQPNSKFVATADISAKFNKAEPVTYTLTSPVSATQKQYRAVGKVITESTLDEMFTVVNKKTSAVIGNPVVTVTEGGYGLSLDLSALELENDVTYTIKVNDMLVDEWYQTVIAEDLDITLSDSLAVYVEKIADTVKTVTQITANVKLVNPGAGEKPVWFVIAAYDQYNEMLAVKVISIPAMTPGEVPYENISITGEDGIDLTRATSVRAYVWDGYNTMCPYGAAAELLNN